MITQDWVQYLLENGDPIEQYGVNMFKLGNSFPKYAEFWGKYVDPNRVGTSFSLRPGFPKEIEDIFNYHYMVFYHFVYTCAQMGIVDNFTYKFLFDISDPLYHLSTVRDMASKVIIALLHVELHLPASSIIELNHEDFRVLMGDRLSKNQFQKYQLVFNEFQKFKASKPWTDFNDLYYWEGNKAGINIYRNLFTHGLPAPRPVDNGVLQLPKREELAKYRDGRYSSERHQVKPENFVSARTLLDYFVIEATARLGEIWQIVIDKMAAILKSKPYKDIVNLQDTVSRIPQWNMLSLEDSANYSKRYNEVRATNRNYTGGTLSFEFTDNQDTQLLPPSEP